MTSRTPIARGIRRSRLALTLLALAALAPAPALAQGIDNKGVDFLFAFMSNNGTGGTEVHLTADTATQVTVRYPSEAPTFTQNVMVQPGQISVVQVPTGSATAWLNDGVTSNLVRASAETEFVAYLVNRIGATSDAALALPIDALNTDYVVAGIGSRDEFVVFAPFDDTSVTITPTAAIGNRPAGAPFQVALNRGQGYYAQASGDLSGTLITAGRPVGVSNGNVCIGIPGGGGFGACDHLFEVAQPVQSWGNSIPVANLPLRQFGSIYRIFAAEDATTVLLDGTAVGTVINRGQFLQVPATVVQGQNDLIGNHVFSSEKPILVVQYMTGQPNGGTGDPAIGNMIPSDQYLSAYTFATPGTQFVQNFVTIIAANADVGVLTLDGTAVAANNFSSIGTSGFSAAVLAIAQGTHTTSSPNPHGITVEGYNSFDSYLYPGGAQFEFINPVGDANPPICSLVVESQEPLLLAGTGADNRPSEDTNGNDELDPGEDLNGNGEIDEDKGIRSVALDEGAANANLSVDADFTPGDPTVSFTISEIETGLGVSGTVRVTDIAGNTCTASLGEAGSGRFESGDWGEAFDTTEAFPDGDPGVPVEPHVLGFFAAQTDGVHILDVTDPANIVPLGQYQPASCNADGVQVLPFADEVVYVESQDAIYVGLGPCGIHIVDVSGALEPGFAPALIGSFDTPGWVEKLEVVESGDQGTCQQGAPVLTYVADFDSVRILDTSDPGAVQPCSSLDATNDDLGDGPFLGVDSLTDPETDVPYLGVAAADGFRLLDVSNPQEPSVETGASYQTPGAFSPPEFAGFEVDTTQDVLTGTVIGPEGELVSGTVLSSWAAGLQILTFELGGNGATSEFFQHEPTDSAVYATQLCGGLALCAAEGQAGLAVLAYDEEDEEFTRTAAIPIGPENAWAWDLHVRECVAYVTWGETAGGTGGLDVVPIPDCGVMIIGDDADADLDGIPDTADNCVHVANADQGDANLDGFGGLCDGDASGDGGVGVPDFAILTQAFGAVAGDSGYHAGADTSSDGGIGVPDFAILLDLFGSSPGPSGLACAGSPPCP
jgi:hypothetical protein